MLAGIAVIHQANAGGTGVSPDSSHSRTTVRNAIRPGYSALVDARPAELEFAETLLEHLHHRPEPSDPVLFQSARGIRDLGAGFRAALDEPLHHVGGHVQIQTALLTVRRIWQIRS